MRLINSRAVVKGSQTFNSLRTHRQAEVNKGCSEPLSFMEIFGDLSDCKFTGALELNDLNLNSLKGIPCELANSSLKHRKISTTYIIFL